MRNPFILTVLLSILSLQVFSQIDVTKYADSELFQVKPVITKVISSSSSLEETVEMKSWFDHQLEIASNYWTKGDLDDAVAIYEDLTEEYPEAAFLDYYIALIDYERGRYDDAASKFTSALTKDPLLLEARYFLGVIALDSDNRKEAKKQFKLLEPVPAYSSYAYHGLGLLALQDGNSFKSYNLLKRCVEQDPSFLEAYIPMISIDIFYNRIKRARNLIEKGVKANPEWQEGIMIRGMIALLQDENSDQFEKDLDYLIELAPDNYHYHLMRGFLQVELKNYHNAVEDFTTAYNLQVDSVKTGEFKFNTKLERNEAIQRSLQYYKAHFGMEPEVRKYIDRAICHFMDDNSKDALMLLDSANEIEPSAVSYTLKGAIYRSKWNKEKDAIRAFSKAIELDSMHWTAYTYRAALYMETDVIDSAYMDYDNVVRLEPKRKEGYKNRGIILMESKNYHKAYRDFSTALGIDQTDYDLYFNRAIATMNMGYIQEAETDLRTIIKHKPEDGEAYYFMHVLQLNQGDTLGAIVYLDSASKHSKYKKKYHEELIDLASKKEIYASTLAGYDRLIKYNSWNADYLFRRGKFLYDCERYEAAVRDLNKWVEKKKRSGEGYYYLGQALIKTNQLKQGQKALKKAKRYGYRNP